jgi:hypothetical protein
MMRTHRFGVVLALRVAAFAIVCLAATPLMQRLAGYSEAVLRLSMHDERVARLLAQAKQAPVQPAASLQAWRDSGLTASLAQSEIDTAVRALLQESGAEVDEVVARIDSEREGLALVVVDATWREPRISAPRALTVLGARRPELGVTSLQMSEADGGSVSTVAQFRVLVRLAEAG